MTQDQTTTDTAEISAPYRTAITMLNEYVDALAAKDAEIERLRAELAELRAKAARPAPSEEPGETRAETWCICGSMRFFDEMLAVATDETIAGRIVLMPYSVIAPDNQDSPVKAMLDRLHRQKIDQSIGIIVVTRDGYIGHSTRGEIEYAEQTGKRVRYMHLPAREQA